MDWRRCCISYYLEELFFPKKGFRVCRLVLGIRIEGVCFKSGLPPKNIKSGMIPIVERRHLGFDVDLDTGHYGVLADRWEVFHIPTDALLMARGGRVQARALASLIGAVFSMRLAWAPVYKLYTRHRYALINTLWSLI